MYVPVFFLSEFIAIRTEQQEHRCEEDGYLLKGTIVIF